MLGHLKRDRGAPAVTDEPGRLADALTRLAMPDAPAARPWEFSAGAFLRPHMPAAAGRAAKLLDRLGAVRIGPAGVGVDSQGDVAWTDVVEIRTRNLFDVLSDGFVEELRRRCSELAPPLPGMGWVSRRVADGLAELILSAFLLALPDTPDRGVPDVPAEIVHRGRRGRPQHMSPGLVASAVLALPAVRESMFATARAHGVTVVASGPSAVTAAAGARSAVLAHRRSQLTAQLERLRGADADARPSTAGDSHRNDVHEGETRTLFGRPRKPPEPPPQATLGQGRELRSALDIDGCIRTLATALLQLREPQYEHMPPLFSPGWSWRGDESARPDTAFVCFDDKKEFLFVALRSTADATAVTMIPLELGDEQSTVGMWKQLDRTLTSCGLSPRGLVALGPPPVPDDIVDGMLRVGGYPSTPHNVDVLMSMLTRQFGLKAYQFISNSNEAEGRQFLERHQYHPGAGLFVARQILIDLANWNPQMLPYFQDMPMRIRAVMLEALGADGTFWSDMHR